MSSSSWPDGFDSGSNYESTSFSTGNNFGDDDFGESSVGGDDGDYGRGDVQSRESNKVGNDSWDSGSSTDASSLLYDETGNNQDVGSEHDPDGSAKEPEDNADSQPSFSFSAAFDEVDLPCADESPTNNNPFEDDSDPDYASAGGPTNNPFGDDYASTGDGDGFENHGSHPSIGSAPSKDHDFSESNGSFQDEMKLENERFKTPHDSIARTEQNRAKPSSVHLDNEVSSHESANDSSSEKMIQTSGDYETRDTGSFYDHDENDQHPKPEDDSYSEYSRSTASNAQEEGSVTGNDNDSYSHSLSTSMYGEDEESYTEGSGSKSVVDEYVNNNSYTEHSGSRSLNAEEEESYSKYSMSTSVIDEGDENESYTEHSRSLSAKDENDQSYTEQSGSRSYENDQSYTERSGSRSYENDQSYTEQSGSRSYENDRSYTEQSGSNSVIDEGCDSYTRDTEFGSVNGEPQESYSEKSGSQSVNNESGIHHEASDDDLLESAFIDSNTNPTGADQPKISDDEDLNALSHGQKIMSISSERKSEDNDTKGFAPDQTYDNGGNGDQRISTDKSSHLGSPPQSRTKVQFAALNSPDPSEYNLEESETELPIQRSPLANDHGSIFSPSHLHISSDAHGSEASMGIGEVFGQPNELFEYDAKDDSPQSEGNSTKNGLANGDHKQLEVNALAQQEDLNRTKSRNGNTKVKKRADGKKSDRNMKKSKLVFSEKEKRKKKRRKKKRRRRKREAKSAALLDFAANVNETILNIEDDPETNEKHMDSSANRLLHGFDALLGIFLQLSDELELIVTFSPVNTKPDEKEAMHVHALKAILCFADTFDQLFADLKPIILDCFEEEPDEYMDDVLYRLNSLVDLICETTHRVGERQEWNERAETTYVTLLELIERDSLDLRCYFDDTDTPDQGISANVHEAWLATGHIEELKALQHNDDPILFRQICYEVMVSTDQWCPDINVLMEVCDIDPEMLDEEPDQEFIDDEELAPIPQAAEHILDKVNGDTLRRVDEFASILRRILPPRAVTDTSLLDHFTSIRNTINSPLGLSATNIVSITSVPESRENPNALGVAGVGKTTLAAMVAEHPDVRRHFIDGVVWVYVGEEELNYSRYTQCLRELVAQLDFYNGVPLFAELLHVPGESMSKRRRREEGFMIYARDTIAGLLENRSVLIILDDICWEPDMDWFDFAPMPDESVDGLGDNCALVITTRCRNLLPAAETVEIDMLDEADAISLLIQESGQLSHTLMAESKEARSVVRECANHPLAVKSVGRWLNLKHATAGVVSSVEEIHSEVVKSMDKILKGGDNTRTDMMYEILSTSLSPAINGGPTNIIKFCFAAFIVVFCDRAHISEFALTEPTPIIPMDMAELLFQTLLEMYEVSLLKKGSLFYAQKKEAAVLIPEALSALGVLKVITYSDGDDEEENFDDEQKFLQVMHSIHHEYGEYLAHDDPSLKDFTKDAERQWNRAIVDAYLSRVEEWDTGVEDGAHSYALEMIISHMIRGAMYNPAASLLVDKGFIRGRLLSLGRESATKRHIKDCEMLCSKLKDQKHRGERGPKLEVRSVMKHAYQALGRQLTMDTDETFEDKRMKQVDVARAHYEVGFSLAENRCWDAAIAHWETSHQLLLTALGPVEVVAGILYNIGVVYSEINEYEKSLDALKRCLKIRGSTHGEEHILYAKTIQKIGDVFLNMSDYKEAMESYDWALDVMYKEPDHHHIEIGEILDNKGTIHYSKGEIEEALHCHQEALRSKQQDLGEDHPELSTTYHHIGNCLSDQGNVDDAIVHFEEAIRLKELDPDGGPEGDADVLTIEGILNNLEGNQEQGLECYEKSLQILVTKVPYRKEKIASLLHLIGCVYLMGGEQKKAMTLFEESLQARRKVLGFVHLDVASTLFNMAFLHQTRNRLDKALRCLEEALKIRQLRLPNSEKVAVTHEKIGSLARGIGKAKKAQIAFEEALRIRKLIHGEQHEAVATALQELGDLMDDLGEYESAMTFYIDALDIRRSRLGLDDIAVAETLYSMGYTLHNNDEPERALVCFVEALSIRRYQLGEDSKEVGDTLNMMGFLKAKRGELDDALTLLWDALRIRKLQEDHIKVSETLKNIGNVHREKDELDLAIECYEECLRIRRSELGLDHEKVADALIAMGNIHSDMKRTEKAMEAYEEALKIRTTVFGENDERVAAVLQYMGTMEFRENNFDKARSLLTEFIRIRQDNSIKNDGDYVNVLFMIGNIHKMEGRETEAKTCWKEAYQAFQALGLSETNPQIAEVMNNLLAAENLDEQEIEPQNRKSLFGIVSEKFKKDKDKVGDGVHQKGRARRKSKGFKL